MSNIYFFFNNIKENFFNIIYKYHSLIVFITWLIYLYLCDTKWLSILSFCICAFIIYMYKYLFELSNKLEQILLKWEKKNIYFIIFILIRLSIFNNLILFYIPRLELWIYNFITYLEKKINIKIKKWILIILLILFSIPFKFILYKFYNILYKFKHTPMSKIMWDRGNLLIISILILTDFFSRIINISGGFLFLFCFIYILFIIINIRYVVKNNGHLKYNYNLLELLEKRKEISLLCHFFINLLLKKNLLEDFIKIYGSKIHFEIFYFLNIQSYTLEKNKSKLLIINYHDVNESIHAIDNKKIYIDFLAQLKNNFSYLFENLTYLKYYVHNVHDDFTIINKEDVDALYILHYLVLKTLIFFIWDIENKIIPNYDIKDTIIIKNDDGLISITYNNIFNIYDLYNNQKLINLKNVLVFDLNDILYRKLYEYSILYKSLILFFEDNNVLQKYNEYNKCFKNIDIIELIASYRLNNMDYALELKLESLLNDIKKELINSWYIENKKIINLLDKKKS